MLLYGCMLLYARMLVRCYMVGVVYAARMLICSAACMLVYACVCYACVCLLWWCGMVCWRLCLCVAMLVLVEWLGWSVLCCRWWLVSMAGYAMLCLCACLWLLCWYADMCGMCVCLLVVECRGFWNLKIKMKK